MPLMAQKAIAWRQEYCKNLWVCTYNADKIALWTCGAKCCPKLPFFHEESSFCFCGVLFLPLLLARTDIFCLDCLACVTTKIPGKGRLLVFCLTLVLFTHSVQNSLLWIVMTMFSLCSLAFEYASLYFY